MAGVSVHYRNSVTGRGLTFFIVGLSITTFLSLVAFFALLTNAIVFYSSDEPGDVYAIIFGFMSISITIGILALFGIYFFIRGLVLFHKTKRDYPGTMRERHVNLATLCMVIVVVFFVVATLWGTGLFPDFRNSEWVIGTGIYIPGTILYGLFFSVLLLAFERSRLLVYSGFLIIVLGGISFLIIPLLFAILAFIGNVLLLSSFIHAKIIISHATDDHAQKTRGRKDLAAQMYRRSSSRHGDDTDYDIAANPYTARQHRGSASEAEIRKMFREKKEQEGPKVIPKKVPKEMRQSKCPLCGGKLPNLATLTNCPHCGEDVVL